MIVTPERDTPGWRASACAVPRSRPSFGPIESNGRSLRARRSTTTSRRPNATSMIGDQPGLAELLLDRVLEQGPGDRAGDRADHERPCDPLVGRRHPASADRSEPRCRVAGDILTEIDEGPEQRPHVEGDVEGLLDVGVADQHPSEHPRDQDQVTRAGDRRELRRPLHEAEDDRLDDAHTVLPSENGRP